MTTSRGKQLAETIRRQVDVLKEACQGVDEELASRAPVERWSPKQILSHLSGPEDGGHLPMLKAFVESDTPRVDLQIANPFFSGTRERMSFTELVAACETNYQRVANFTATLTEEQLARKAHIPELKDSPLGEYPTLAEMINGLGEFHIPFHVDHLREILAALAGKVA
jgi:hypothetical protein